MNIAVFSTKPYDKEFLNAANEAAGQPHHFTYFDHNLNADTAILAQDSDAICAFVNDQLDEPCLKKLHAQDTRSIALRCAGFNNVDLKAAQALGITITRVPDYSPNAVAEHTVALLMALNRRIHRAYARIKEGNYSINGLLGFDLCERTVGIIGTGKIGSIAAKIFTGFGSRIVAYDKYPNRELEAIGVEFLSLDELFEQAEILSLHCPLTPETHHLVNKDSLKKMRNGVIIVNTSRGALIDAHAALAGLKSGKVGAMALDVYEEEEGIFFEDHSFDIMRDDLLARLTTFPNVLITSHQAFFTREALKAISTTTIENLSQMQAGEKPRNSVEA